MNRQFLLMLVTALAIWGQAGSVNFTPPAPGRLDAIAGTIICAVTGDAVPATHLNFTCSVDGTSAPFTIPVVTGAAFTMQWTSAAGDSVTITVKRLSGQPISWQAAATPFGGQTASGSGNF